MVQDVFIPTSYKSSNAVSKEGHILRFWMRKALGDLSYRAHLPRVDVIKTQLMLRVQDWMRSLVVRALGYGPCSGVDQPCSGRD